MSYSHQAQRYWLELVTAEALQVLKHYLEYNALEHRKDLLGLKQALTQYPDFPMHLETAPTRQPELFKRFSQSLGCAWQP